MSLRDLALSGADLWLEPDEVVCDSSYAIAGYAVGVVSNRGGGYGRGLGSGDGVLRKAGHGYGDGIGYGTGYGNGNGHGDDNLVGGWAMYTLRGRIS